MSVALTYKQTDDTGKTKVWSVAASGTPLGAIRWYSQWRRYVFYPHAGTLYDAECLHDITSFIEARMRDRKASGQDT